MAELAPNIDSNVDNDGVLTLKIDLNKETGKTAKGFTRVASTLGNKDIEHEGQVFKLGLNVYTKGEDN